MSQIQLSSSYLPQPQGPVWIAGAGVSGRGAAELVRQLGWSVCIVDSNISLATELAHQYRGSSMTVQDAYSRLHEASLIVTSPGWRPDTPLLRDAQARGIPVIGDVELAWCADRDGRFGKPRTWLAVTGTNGKTTATSMLAAMMEKAGAAAEAVGNIGVAVGTALTQTPRVDIMVAELSSFQLHWAPTFTPDAGVILNLAEDHIDWHGSMDAYAGDKARVYRGDIAVVNSDDERVCDEAKRYVVSEPVSPHDGDDSCPHVIGFTMDEPSAGEIGIVDGRIVDRVYSPANSDGIVIADATSISPPGAAGVADALAATAIARSQGVEPDAIAEALSSFVVQKHRGQVVHEADGIRWIDNSKATNPHATDAALSAVDSCVWIAGGQLKGACVDEVIAKNVERISAAVVLGQDREVIRRSLMAIAPRIPLTVVTSMDPVAAMTEAVQAAGRLAQPGDTVLLAPAAASLDMYTGMGQRGDLFADAARRFGTTGLKDRDRDI
ncbi:UDP-N-acetylmuramoyl-L-alanine--D-glutamate ligase [Corynebacterium kroppenstedtii]